jgi:hypothetical protein
MTIGIYALYWEEQDLIYIGQSQNIKSRFKEHSSKLIRNKHTNYKVQNVYNIYGAPQLYTVEECNLNLLNELEIYWTEDFDSLNPQKGLNIIEAGTVGFGVNSNSSKYSKRQILKTFSLLYSTKLSYREISSKTGVSSGTVCDISNGYTHSWLKEGYPYKYILMLHRTSRQTCAKTLGRQYPKLISPDNIEYSVENILQFCSHHPVLSLNIENSRKNIGRLLLRTRSSWHGWTVKVI